MIIARFGQFRQRCQRGLIPTGELGALRFHPLVELLRVVEKKAIEKRAAVRRGRFLQIARAHRRLKRQHVHGDATLAQPNVVADAADGSRAELLSDVVDGLAEEVAGTRRVSLRPEQADQAVAGDAPRVRAAEDGKKRQPVAMHRSATHGALVRIEQRRSAEQTQFEWPLRGGGASGRHSVKMLYVQLTHKG